MLLVEQQDYGIMQINRVHYRRVYELGYQWKDMLEVGPNVHVAFHIYNEMGWQPWSCARTRSN